MEKGGEADKRLSPFLGRGRGQLKDGERGCGRRLVTVVGHGVCVSERDTVCVCVR